MKKIVMAAMVAMLVGCGGGDPEDIEAESFTTSAVRASMDIPEDAPVVKVALFGDSTEDGARAGTNNALILQSRYDKAGRAIRIWEEAVGGTTALQLLTGKDRQHGQTFDQTMATSEAQIVGFRFGLNDQRFYSADTFSDVLEALVRIAEGAGKVVIVQVPSPIEHQTREVVLAIQANVRVIRALATAHPSVILCDHRIVGREEGFQTLDGIHPTAFDYRRRQSVTLKACINEAIERLPT